MKNPLSKYLSEIGVRPMKWAFENNISRSVISRYLNGRCISPANAQKIEQATDGKVTILELLFPESND